MHLTFSKPKAFFELFWTHDSTTCHQQWMLRGPSSFQHRCHDGFVSRRPPPLTFTHAWAILPSLPGIDSIVPSSTPTTAPRLLSIATKTPPDVCLRSSSPAVSQVIIAALAANLHPSLASLLNCSFISSFLHLCSIPTKISNFPLYLLMHFFLCSTLTHLIRCTLTSSLLFSFQVSQLHLAVSTFSETCPSASQSPGLRKANGREPTLEKTPEFRNAVNAVAGTPSAGPSTGPPSARPSNISRFFSLSRHNVRSFFFFSLSLSL